MAHVPFREAMAKCGLKPLYGCEFYIVENLHDRTRAQEALGVNAFPHITVLAETQKGYENLLALSRISWTEGRYYKPRIDSEHLWRHQEGLVVLSGCPGGWPTRLILNKGELACYVWLQQMRARIERFYVELDPCPGLDISEKTLGALVAMAADLKLPCVLTADPHFPRPSDHLAQDTLLCVGMGKTMDDEERKAKLRLPENLYYCEDHELIARARQTAPEVSLPHWLAAIANTRAVADRCQVEIPHADRVQFAGLKPGQTAGRCLLDAMMNGVTWRSEQGQIPAEQRQNYLNRAFHEWEVLKEKGFCDYILAIADVIQHMKRQNCMVVTRGSAGGCLLLWLLGASVTDPIKHDLSFERFYDPSRPDPPDVDVDFEQGRREEAIEYVRQQYGEECCSQLAAISQLKARSAVLDVAFAFGIPKAEVAPLTAVLKSDDEDLDAQLDTVTDPKALAVLEKYPVLRELVPKLIGQYRQPSIHAAGVVISSLPLDRCVGIMLGKSGQHVASVDKRSAAKLGLLKMDFLSVASLDVIGATVRKLGWQVEDLERLPLDDPQALALADQGYLAGIFQLDGAAAARVARQIGLTSFADMVAASALCRPGPGDWVETYAHNKSEPERFSAYLGAMPVVAAVIVQDTYGILLYQEQVMRLARELAGFDWPDVHKLRKGVSDKLGSNPQTGAVWTQEWREKFVAGAVSGGSMSRDDAARWWEQIESHGGYSFNRSHCVTYGLVGYWMAYLKAHHPAEFYDAYLSLENDAVTMKRLIREFRALGGTVKLLDPAASQASFSCPEPGVLVGGYGNLHGIGPKTTLKIMSHTPHNNWQSLFGALPKALSAKVAGTGVATGNWDPQAVILMAPWFPVPCLAANLLALRETHRLPLLSALPKGQMTSGDVTVMGYVTATRFEKDRVMFVIEDETTAILVRVPARQVERIGASFRGLEVADFVAVSGWWAGDTLYAKENAVLQPRPSAPPKAEKGSRPRPAVPEPKTSELELLEQMAREGEQK